MCHPLRARRGKARPPLPAFCAFGPRERGLAQARAGHPELLWGACPGDFDARPGDSVPKKREINVVKGPIRGWNAEEITSTPRSPSRPAGGHSVATARGRTCGCSYARVRAAS